MTTYITGYYGIPGREGGQIHVRRNDGTNLCGYKPHPKAEFQWCAYRIVPSYIECHRCKERAQAILDKFELNRLRTMHPKIYQRLIQSQS